ncbi:MAG: hypothetical protein IKX61_00535 [Prevotella sp.]|nr:hypothetical protein [Prevotella sp.]
MILYVLKQNKNSKSAAYGKFFAYPVIEETIDLDALAEHMSNHNTPYSKGAIKGMLTDMVGCIKELLLEGKNVKIADLAIFSLGIKNNCGAVSEEAFTVSKNIKGVKLRARATGELIAKSLNLEATLKKASATSKTSGNGGSNGGGSTPTGDDTNNGGSQSQSGSGSSQSGGESQNGGTNGGTNGGSQSGGSSSNTGGNSGSQSGTEQGQEGDYRLVIYKYGNGTSTVTDDSEQEINSNDQVHSGSNVNISVVPVEGKDPIAKVNGNRITLTENDGTYTGSFQMPTKGTVLEINSEPDEWDYADQN